jgi:putative YphP/YqiW family bacilliredoxin
MFVQQRYPEPFIAPMRSDLTKLGFEELRSPELVDEAVKRPGTTLLVVNSVCIALSLRAGARPDHLTTVFAGADVEATQQARGHMAPYPPSSPSIALFKDGTLVYMMERRQIEGAGADAIAAQLQQAYDEHCR